MASANNLCLSILLFSPVPFTITLFHSSTQSLFIIISPRLLILVHPNCHPLLPFLFFLFIFSPIFLPLYLSFLWMSHFFRGSFPFLHCSKYNFPNLLMESSFQTSSESYSAVHCTELRLVNSASTKSNHCSVDGFAVSLRRGRVRSG